MPSRVDGVVLRGWYRLEEAWSLPEARFAGVYFLANFKNYPTSIAPSNSDIIYIGETCGQTLRQRWKQFASSAFSNNGGHSGGDTYFKLYTKKYRKMVAVGFATPVYEEPLLSYRIRYLERKWLFEYVRT